jgi:hypothetical protein
MVAAVVVTVAVSRVQGIGCAGVTRLCAWCEKQLSSTPTSHASCKARADASYPAANDTSYLSSKASLDAYAQLPLEFAP